MARWEFLESAAIPHDGGELRLFQREMAKDNEFAIRISGQAGDLMNSRQHGSEDALGELPCRPLAAKPGARVLIGGLGMGFTLSAALAALGADAEVVVAELVPGVVTWNQGIIGQCAGFPLQDPRTRIEIADVHTAIRIAAAYAEAEADIAAEAESAAGTASASLREAGRFDAIMLDVDNGPEGLTHEHNDRLYSTDGLGFAYSALRPGGILAVWSAGPERSFTARLQKVGFSVDERRVRAHAGKGARHVIWLATKPKPKLHTE